MSQRDSLNFIEYGLLFVDMMNNNHKKIPKLAIVGLGSQGKKHFEAALALEKQGVVVVVATCDPVLQTTNHGTHYQHFNQMLELEKIDVVIIAVPHIFHQNMCQQALEKGISVIKEVPVALTLDQVVDLQKRARKRKASVITCQQRFFKQEWIALQKLVADAEEILSFHFTFCVDDTIKSWYWDIDQSGGGVWLTMGWHPMQMIDWLFGLVKTVEVKIDSGRKRQWQYQMEHAALANVVLENGISGSIFVSCVHSKQDLVRVETKQGVISLVGKKVAYIANGTSQTRVYQDVHDPYLLQLEASLKSISEHKTTLKQDREILKNILLATEK